jgi:hypothetical protein
MLISETVTADIENPADTILREAARHIGVTTGSQHDGGGNSGGYAPSFETGVNEDGDDTDLFILGYDRLGDATRLLGPDE